MNPSTIVGLVSSFCLGYFVASYLRGGNDARPTRDLKAAELENELLKAKDAAKKKQLDDLSVESEDESSGEEGASGSGSESEDEELKMVLVVRMDLKMGPGKAAAQCSHATLGAYQRAVKKNLKGLGTWSKYGQMKVTLKAKDEEELLNIERKAKEMGVNHYMVVDAGRTQIKSGSKTVIALGPASKPLLDKITGHLKLY